MGRMLRQVFLRSLLAFFLLFAQQGALSHGIAHTLAEQSQDQSLPHDKHCNLCEGYAQIDGAIGSSQIHLDFAASFGEARPVQSHSFHSRTFAAFAARAPPCFA